MEGFAYETKWLGVMIDDDNKWYFGNTGIIIPFEEIEKYKAKKIKDRFTPEMLNRYAQHLGIRTLT